MRRKRLGNLTLFHLTLRKFTQAARPTRDTTVMHPYKKDFEDQRRGPFPPRPWQWSDGLAMQPLHFAASATPGGVRWQAIDKGAVRRWYAADKSKASWQRACDADGGVRCVAVPRAEEFH
jgi:hypothetical protein